MNQDKYYRTSDLNLAVFLFSKIQNIPEVEWLNGEKKEFAFEKSEKLNRLVKAYSFGGPNQIELMVNVKFIESAREQLLERIKRS